jgi:hypothetical protein
MITKHRRQGILLAIDGGIKSKSELERVREDYHQEHKQIPSITFRQFEALNAKPRPKTQRELFQIQLRLFRSVDAEKAAAITDIYPSLLSLIRAYDLLDSEREKEELLANITTSISKKKLGIQASKKIYQFYCLDDYS